MVRRALGAGGVVLVMLLGQPAAAARRPVTVVTPALVPDPDGFLQCVAIAVGHQPIDMLTALVTADGQNVTEFGSSLRIGPARGTQRRYVAEDRAGTLDDRQSRCRVTVSNVNRRDVFVVFTSHDRNGVVLDAVAG